MSGGAYYTDPQQGEGFSYIVGEDSLQPFYGSGSTSRESSMGSPAMKQDPEDFNAFCHPQYHPLQPYLYQYQTPDMYHAAHLASTIELKIEDLYEDVDLRTKRTSGSNPATSQVHSRRRAQNRASQRAFRSRKEKHVKEVEERLQELEGKYNDLSESYESLQTEYVLAKQQLEKLTREEGLMSLSTSPRDSLVLTDPGFGAGGSSSSSSGEDLSNAFFENEVFSFEAAAQ